MQIKLRATDRIFTKIVRIIFKYTCQKCGREYRPDEPLGNLGVSHYYGRARENTRYDISNVSLLCNFPCHRSWEGEERLEYKEYMIKRLGQEGFDILTLKAHTYHKRDDKMTLIILKAWLKELS